ncbi:hypothetical protein H8356DRAFT_1338360 [Neocallimastix lanati (nom. inval.)]|nr:hypothetical protein H8356DRAFT_1338360 [Neocallimastix sp. JGI-2020a]
MEKSNNNIDNNNNKKEDNYNIVKSNKSFKIKQIDIIIIIKNFLRLYMDLRQAEKELNNESNNFYINLRFKQLIKIKEIGDVEFVKYKSNLVDGLTKFLKNNFIGISKKFFGFHYHLEYLDGLTECSSNWRYVIQNIIENFLSVSPVPNFPFKSRLIKPNPMKFKISLRRIYLNNLNPYDMNSFGPE